MKTKWKYILSGAFYANGPCTLEVESGNEEWAMEEIAEMEGVDVEDVSAAWEVTDESERQLLDLLCGREQMTIFRNT